MAPPAIEAESEAIEAARKRLALAGRGVEIEPGAIDFYAKSANAEKTFVASPRQERITRLLRREILKLKEVDLFVLVEQWSQDPRFEGWLRKKLEPAMRAKVHLVWERVFAGAMEGGREGPKYAGMFLDRWDGGRGAEGMAGSVVDFAIERERLRVRASNKAL